MDRKSKAVYIRASPRELRTWAAGFKVMRRLPQFQGASQVESFSDWVRFILSAVSVCAVTAARKGKET